MIDEYWFQCSVKTPPFTFPFRRALAQVCLDQGLKEKGYGSMNKEDIQSPGFLLI